jgi:hypothetical protein
VPNSYKSISIIYLPTDSKLSSEKKMPGEEDAIQKNSDSLSADEDAIAVPSTSSEQVIIFGQIECKCSAASF